MTLKETLDKTVHFFKAKGLDNPRVDTEYLFHHALGLERIDLYVNFERIMTEQELDQLRPLIKRRGQGEPVAYITGEREFYGFPYKVNSSVLIPRPETELIVDQVLDCVKAGSLKEDMHFIDLGTGSGCIGLTLAKKLESSRSLLVDVSSEAIGVAKGNGEDLSVLDRVEFLEQDASTITMDQLPQNFEGRVDVVVANPPYIAESDQNVASDVREFEPSTALFCEDQGYALPEKWLEVAWSLNPQVVVFEMGYNQGERLKQKAQSIAPEAQVEVIQDYNQQDRILVISRK
ncbi:MAG: protein-(glutamine-N5) methyltransferase, release factor-specific [Bdellovibrionaceae bacterium]|nr:protein-(glutamine-N5) methyltransferase, release factor-specific [Pseudobdellovibrionaceae bacterium]|tara:strand:- start:40333 stop:41202 length:870 start_codon:yes stop_codon:yes gene_type:complete